MAQTPTWGLPYPEPATLITDSAAIVQELAEKIDTALSAVTASDAYTVPGTLIADMTTSGTFTPPAGVTVVHVVVIGGGGRGGNAYNDGATGQYACGGAGGEIAVFRGVPVSGDTTVTIGGSGTNTAFGALSARAGLAPLEISPIGGFIPPPGWTIGGSYVSWGGHFYDVAPYTRRGHNGVRVNGTYYTGGGGAGYSSGGTWPVPTGGAGGGGTGAYQMGPQPVVNATPGTSGTGGGGGAGVRYSSGSERIGALGGSGRVMVFTEQPTMRRNAPTPNPDPLMVAALDADGTMTGAYAVDVAAKELPATGVKVIDYPTEPVDTGRTYTAPHDPDGAGPTVELPVLAWPEAGWTWTDSDGWKEPHDQATA